jgi:hypothetical protein
VASILVDHVVPATSMSFADPVKRAGRGVLNLPGTLFYTDAKNAPCEALGGQTPRAFLQDFGTRVMRGCYGENVWLISFLLALREVPPSMVVVVPDMRFKNELALARALGATCVRVDASTRAPSTSDHPSETDLDDAVFDLTIDNNGALADLPAKVGPLLDWIAAQ